MTEEYNCAILSLHDDESRIKAMRAASESKSLENRSHEVVVAIRRASSSDTIRKSSESRLLDQGDLRHVERIIAKKKTSEEKVDGAKPPGIFEFIPEEGDKFVYSQGITTDAANELLARWGLNLLPEKVTPKWYIFASQLWQPMPLMLWIAAIIEISISNYIDFAILMLILFGNASISYYETTKAGEAISALKASLKPEATVMRDGKWVNLDATFLVPGDLVLLATGSAISADCRINEGTIDVDQAALTGESLPVTMYKGDSCKMGSTVVRGEVEGTVEFTGANTYFGKTASLLSGPTEFSNLQKTLMCIMIVLVVISVTLCIIVFVYLYYNKETVKSALGFTVVLLVASIPLAMEIVTTTTLALGSKELSRHGAIVSRLAAIEDMAGMAILCSDKTGTLTLNQMVIQEETPVYVEGESQYTLLRYAAMAAKWKEPPRDALDTLTLRAADMNSMSEVEQLSYMPFDPVVKRTEATIKEIKTGKVFKTTKGAPHVLMKLVDDPIVSARVEEDVHALGIRGIRSLAVAKTDDNDIWRFLGLLTFLDPPRPDTKQTIRDARRYGVAVKMITGDHVLIAKETARVLELGTQIISAEGLPLLDPETQQKPKNLARDYGELCLSTDGFAQVFPEHKYLIVECLRELGYKTGMTGDGVNDAPALKRADVGVAVAGATDAARAAADIVLTQPGLSTIVHGIIISRGIFARIRNFLTYRIAATLQLLIFFFIAIFAFKPIDFYNPTAHFVTPGADRHEWPRFFHMPVILLMLITLLNDGTLIAIGYDSVLPKQTPERWNLAVLFTIGGTLAGVACVSSLFLLYWLLSSWHPNGLFQSMGLGGLSYGQVTTAVYLKVSISDFLSLFSARAGSHFFWSSRPANVLLIAAMVALSSSTVLSLTWPSSYPDNIFTLGLSYHPPYELAVYIWIYCIIWWFIQDALKVFVYTVLIKYNIFGINNIEMMALPPSVNTSTGQIRENS